MKFVPEILFWMLINLSYAPSYTLQKCSTSCSCTALGIQQSASFLHITTIPFLQNQINLHIVCHMQWDYLIELYSDTVQVNKQALMVIELKLSGQILGKETDKGIHNFFFQWKLAASVLLHLLAVLLTILLRWQGPLGFSISVCLLPLMSRVLVFTAS